MSDRVATYCGKMPKWNHFQFAPRPYSSITGRPEETVLNLPLTLKQTMELCWRVKKFKITGSGTVVTLNPDPPPTFLDSSITRFATFESGNISSFDDDTGFPITYRESNTREIQLVSGVYDTPWIYGFDQWERWGFGADLTEQGGSGEGVGMDISFGFSNNLSARILFIDFADSSNPIFYPCISISFGGYVSSLRNSYDLASQGSFTLILQSGTIVDPLGSWPEVTSGDPPYNAINLTMEATEWWPYKTTTGLPVYDTSTGAILNDPLS